MEVREIGGSMKTAEGEEKFRIVVHIQTNDLTGEEVRRYRIQESVRCWWKLYLGFTWANIEYESEYPGYYMPLLFECKEDAVSMINEICRSRRWSKIRTVVID